MAQKELLKCLVGWGEAQDAGAESADGPGRRLQDPYAVLVHSHFGVDGAVLEAERGHRGLGGFADLTLDSFGLAGGRDVDGLFKVGAFQRVGFVEYRQRLERSAR